MRKLIMSIKFVSYIALRFSNDDDDICWFAAGRSFANIVNQSVRES